MAYRKSIKKYKISYIFIFCFLMLGYFFYHVFFTKQLKTENTFMPLVDGYTIGFEPFISQRKYIGYVIPINSVSVKPFISGFISNILIDDGEEVQEGQTLFVLKQDEYQAQLNLAEANVLSAQAKFINDQSYYERVKKAGDKSVSKAQIDDARAQFLTSFSALQSALAEVDIARINYDYTVIKAPISGLTGYISVSIGDYVSPSSDSLVNIVQYNPIRVKFSISDKEYISEIIHHKDIFKDWIIKLRLSDGSIYPYYGYFSYFNNVINLNTNSLTIYVDFPNPKKVLIANAYVDVILEKNVNKALQVPLSDIHWNDKNPFVYTLNKEHILEKKEVVLGEIQNERAHILEGLQPGDFIVSSKVDSLFLGKKVNIVGNKL